ncbi:hypothetical protein BH11PSE14_BH11PSE14_19860 [soil metagenome]
MGTCAARANASGRSWRIGTGLLALISFVLLASPCFAHEGLHEQIVETTARLAKDPRNAGLRLHRAELYRQHEQWALAATDYDAAQRLAPALAEVHLGRGQMLQAMARLPAAEAQLDAYLATVPGSVDGHATRARIRASRGNAAGAAADFDATIAARHPSEPEYYLERAQALASAGQVDAALAGLDAGRAELGELVTLGLAAVELEAGRANWDAALTRLDRLADGAQRQEAWLSRRGELLMRAGRMDSARQAWRDARDAIDALPALRRNTPAMISLRAELDARLDERPRG